MVKEYTAVIGLHKGLKYIKKIVDSVEGQSIPPKKIIIWYNQDEPGSYSYTGPNLEFIHSYQNYGVYARFTAGLLGDTDRILILDDDTIPGEDWVKNCFDTIEKVGDESIIGYRGIILKSDALFDVNAREKGNKEIAEVDLVGHAWFVKRKHILALFEDTPANYFNGEDTHLSAINQIKYGTKTYVPKQLLSEPNTWGSTMQHLGAQQGRLSTSLGPQKHFSDRKLVNEIWIKKGWIPLFMRGNNV